MKTVVLKPSRDLNTLLAQYPDAIKNPDKLRGWKRSFTLYCTNRSMETGKPVFRFRASVKAQLTRLGYDTRFLD